MIPYSFLGPGGGIFWADSIATASNFSAEKPRSTLTALGFPLKRTFLGTKKESDKMKEHEQSPAARGLDTPQETEKNTEQKKDPEHSVIALVGPIAAGKGTVAELLIKRGYVSVNYGDVIYEERTKRGLKEERKNSHAAAASLRVEFGNDIIARRIDESVRKLRDQNLGNKILIDGLRHPDEVNWVRSNLGAVIIGITANPEIRYQRAVKRNRLVDPKSPEGFAEVDEEDRGVNSPEFGNQTDACIQLADIIVENNDEDVQGYIIRFNLALQQLGIKEDSSKI